MFYQPTHQKKTVYILKNQTYFSPVSCTQIDLHSFLHIMMHPTSTPLLSSRHYYRGLTKFFPVQVSVKYARHTYTYQHITHPSKNASTAQHTPLHCSTFVHPGTTWHLFKLAGIPPHTSNHTSHYQDTQTNNILFPQKQIRSNKFKQTVLQLSQKNNWKCNPCILEAL